MTKKRESIPKNEKVLTPDMGVDKALIDFGKKVLAKAIAKKAK